MAVTTSKGERPFDCRACSVQVHLHLALLSSIRIGDGDTRHRDQLRADEIETIIVE